MNTHLETKTAVEEIAHKSVGPLGVKVLDDEQGIAELWVSTTGVVDSGKDIIEPGAYARTLNERTPKGYDQHDPSVRISKALAVEEVAPGDDRLPADVKALGPAAGALRIEAQYNLGTQKGREAWEELKFYGTEMEFSIGYVVRPGNYSIDAKTGVRRIAELDLFEYSQVGFGMAPATGATSVKSLDVKAFDGSYEDRRDKVLIAVRDLVAMAYDDDEVGWTWAVATYEDRVVVTLELQNGQVSWWEVPYTLDGDTVTLGEPSEVEVIESIVAKARVVAEAKEGRVLSSANLGKLRAAHEAIAAVLSAAGNTDDDDEDDDKAVGVLHESGALTIDGQKLTATDVEALRHLAEQGEPPETQPTMVPVDVGELLRAHAEAERAALGL